MGAEEATADPEGNRLDQAQSPRASGRRLGLPPPAPAREYSPECVEGAFCELHLTREGCWAHVLLCDQREYPNKAQAKPITPLRVAYIRSHIGLPVENDDKKPSRI